MIRQGRGPEALSFGVMKARGLGLVAVLVLAGCGAQPTEVSSQEILSSEFGADFVVYSAYPEIATQGQVNQGEELTRYEYAGELPYLGAQEIVALAGEESVTLLVPGLKRYLSFNSADLPFELPFDLANPCLLPGASCRPEGVEQVSGRMTLVFSLEAEFMGQSQKVFVWIDPLLGVPLRFAAPERAQIRAELTNLETGAQDSALFEIPSDYRPLTLPNFPLYSEAWNVLLP